MSDKYICPVCGFPDLDEPPYDNGNPSYNICDCCGFEFGYDDGSEEMSFETYRKKWIDEGAKWFTKESKPNNWNLKQQLLNIK